MSRYDDMPEAARQLLADFDEIDLAEMLAAANEANAVLRERVAELEVALVDIQGAPHHGCCPDHNWRGPGRDTSAEACKDIRQHEAETHGKEISHG
ncbi:hypothetical protein [Streptacidiphilus cavernicola]|uniref:Uncharacterized protein n=1 Tax=Streptacidiphilus cavernicola TaxID=3342716 RepID=A0ABV6VXR6_9ACTN